MGTPFHYSERDTRPLGMKMRHVVKISLGIVFVLDASMAKGLILTPDASGNFRDGTVNGSAVAPGLFGNALVFDGLDDDVTMPFDINTSNVPNMTVSMWILANKVARMVPFSNDDGGHDRGFETDYNVGQLWVNTGDNTNSVAGVLNTFAWQHFVLVYDSFSSDVRMYVDGTLEFSSGQAPGVSNGTVPALIGRSEFSYPGYGQGISAV